MILVMQIFLLRLSGSMSWWCYLGLWIVLQGNFSGQTQYQKEDWSLFHTLVRATWLIGHQQWSYNILAYTQPRTKLCRHAWAPEKLTASEGTHASSTIITAQKSPPNAPLCHIFYKSQVKPSSFSSIAWIDSSPPVQYLWNGLSITTAWGSRPIQRSRQDSSGEERHLIGLVYCAPRLVQPQLTKLAGAIYLHSSY